MAKDKPKPSVTIAQEPLSNALAAVSRVAAHVVLSPVVGAMLHIRAAKNEVWLSARNDDTFMRRRLDAKTTGEFELLLPCKLLADFTRELNGDIEIAAASTSAEITCYPQKATVLGVDPKQAPEFPDIGTEPIAIEGDTLAWYINHVYIAADAKAAESGRPILSGLHLQIGDGSLLLSGADSYCLAHQAAQQPGELNAVLPVKTLQLIADEVPGATVEIRLSPKGDMVSFRFGDNEIISRVIEGTFPDVKRLLPKEHMVKVSVDSQDFLKALKAVAPVTAGDANYVTMRLDHGELSLSVDDRDYASASGKVQCYTDDPDTGFAICINPKFLRNGASRLEGKVTFGFTGPQTVMSLAYEADPDLTFLIMPIARPPADITC